MKKNTPGGWAASSLRLLVIPFMAGIAGAFSYQQLSQSLGSPQAASVASAVTSQFSPGQHGLAAEFIQTKGTAHAHTATSTLTPAYDFKRDKDAAFPAGIAIGQEQQQVKEQQDKKLQEKQLQGKQLAVNENFVEAARRSTPSVVFIKTLARDLNEPQSYFDLLFGRRSGPSATSGSGVIYSEDGFIVTNNHVIDGAQTMEVVHNRRSYQARVVGTDPSTDLAVLKIEASGLPSINLGRSAEVEVGEWALAVGNPFNLTSTVTAGIVSAKGREISLTRGAFPLESFIQTDAAINPGNSGGALVNIRGELIGINTAILSQTGSYTGYGFAVPVDVVHKVVDDLINYGEVNKGFIGAEVIDLDLEKAERSGILAERGVVLSFVSPDGAAARAGLREGDIITAINGRPVNSRGIFDEQISYYSPGDQIEINFQRANKAQKTFLTLTNREGTTEILKREVYSSKSLGADLEVVSKVERDRLGISQGVRVSNIQRGFISRLKLEEGFVITRINEEPINSPEKLVNVLSALRGRVIIEGVNAKGKKGFYQYYL